MAMAVWSSLFLEMWKRQQATCALEWDMREFEETQRPRPQFKAAQVQHPRLILQQALH